MSTNELDVIKMIENEGVFPGTLPSLEVRELDLAHQSILK